MARRSIFNAGVHGSIVWHDDYTSGVTVAEVLDATVAAVEAEAAEHHAPDSTAMEVVLRGAREAYGRLGVALDAALSD